ncbi:PAS domain S-box protein, partial [Chloroflexota bacterium]
VETGDEVGIVARTFNDMARRVEEALRRSSEFSETVMSSISDGICIINVDDYRIVGLNNAFLEQLGLKEEEVIGKICYQIMYHRSEPCTLHNEPCPLLDTVRRGKNSEFESELYHSNGEKIYVDVSTSPVKDENGNIIQVIHALRDITERKQAEEALRVAEQNFRNSVDSSPLGIRVIDESGDLLYANRAVLDIYGYSSIGELKATPVKEHYTPESYAEYLERQERRKLGKDPICYEVSVVRKDGGIRHLIVFRGEVIWGGKTQIQMIYQDITERQQAEEREEELQRELNLSRRLASIGELAAGVAHEINNPLTGIIGFSQRLMRKNVSEEVSRDVERIHNEARRVAKVVENLLTFARRRGPSKEYSDINEILARTLELRAYELKSTNIELEVNLAPNLPPVMADFQQIQQVFLNIILNAEQAITEANSRGKLVIQTQKVKDGIRVSFANDGPEIPAEQFDKVFDPFFTTRGKKGGTGLGLSVCHGIVEEHGGKIYVESTPGKGTTFFVELPMATGEIDDSKIAKGDPVRRG